MVKWALMTVLLCTLFFDNSINKLFLLYIYAVSFGHNIHHHSPICTWWHKCYVFSKTQSNAEKHSFLIVTIFTMCFMHIKLLYMRENTHLRQWTCDQMLYYLLWGTALRVSCQLILVNQYWFLAFYLGDTK